MTAAPNADIQTLSPEVFEERRQADVHLFLEDQQVDLEITDIRRLGGDTERTGGAFSVVFAAPSTPELDQAIYQMAIDGIGSLALFLVPVGQFGEQRHYEAVFT